MADQEQSATQQPAPRATTWGQNRRLQFIDFRLRWEGQLNRNDLTSFFGISVPQASLDLARYLDAAPDNLEYDKSTRAYVAAKAFKPLYSRSSSRQYLNDSLAAATGVTDQTASFIGWKPDLEVAPTLGRALDETVVVGLVHAMRNSRQVAVSYQSMSREEPIQRRLSPHALAYDGFRWHVRAFCHLRERYQDFVIARILRLAPGEEAGKGADQDAQWHRKLSLVLAAHPDLPTAARRAIEVDYGMVEGEVRLVCRHAMLFYTLRNLRLDLAPGVQGPRAQQIYLRNRDELGPFIAEATPS